MNVLGNLVKGTAKLIGNTVNDTAAVVNNNTPLARLTGNMKYSGEDVSRSSTSSKQTVTPPLSQPHRIDKMYQQPNDEQTKLSEIKRELKDIFFYFFRKDIKNVPKKCETRFISGKDDECNIDNYDVYEEKNRSETPRHKIQTNANINEIEWLSFFDNVCGEWYGEKRTKRKGDSPYKCNESQNYIDRIMYDAYVSKFLTDKEQNGYLYRMVSAIENNKNQYERITREKWKSFFNKLPGKTCSGEKTRCLFDFNNFFKDNFKLINDKGGGGGRSFRSRKSKRRNKKNGKTKKR
jgi:hypothetical protein